MRRILVLGNAGSGKSTFARRLGERLGVPVIHLDAINWEPGWKPVPAETFRARLRDAISGDAWITDGNYAILTFDLRLPRADLVIWVERSPIACAGRVLRRAWKSHFKADEHLAFGCNERFDRRFVNRLVFIANFDRVNRPRIEAARMRYGPDVPLTVLRGDHEMAEFLASRGDGCNP